MKFTLKKSYLSTIKFKITNSPNEDFDLYEEIGGINTIILTVDYLIHLICDSFDSNEKSVLFETLNKQNISSFRINIISYLVEISGGPKTSKTDYYESDLPSNANQEHFGISNNEFDTLKALYYAILHYHKVDTYLKNQLIASMTTHQNLIVAR